MTIHVLVSEALAGLAGDQVFPLVAKAGTAPPYIVFQVVAGDPIALLSGEKPEKRVRRVQFNVWSKTIIEAEVIAGQIEDALGAAAALQARAVTIAIDTYDEATEYRGKMQDFELFC